MLWRCLQCAPEKPEHQEVHQGADSGWFVPSQGGYRVSLSMAGERRKLADPAVGHLEQAAPHAFLQGCLGGWWSAPHWWGSPPDAMTVAGSLCHPRHPCWPCGYWGVPGDPMGCNPLRLTVCSPWYVTAPGDHVGWDLHFVISIMILWHMTPSVDTGHPMGYEPPRWP